MRRSDDQGSKNCSSEGSTLTGNQSKNVYKGSSKRPSEPKECSKKKISAKKAKKQQEKEDSDYIPEDSCTNPTGQYKLSETKNIPKNYGKSILSYIRKNQKTVHKILDHLGENNEDFELHIQKYKNKINTIADLRALWLEGENPFAKAMRIISSKYVRQHSLSHIFNSRVENHKKHIKYRYKILQGIEDPLKFTQMKDF